MAQAHAAVPAELPLLHAMFQDHAVLQRGQPIRVWGSATPGQDVRVALAGSRGRARADGEGRWQVSLPALPAGGPHRLTVRSGQRTQSLEDVLVGDVWLCSGQSNMELPVRRSLDADSEIAGAAAPTLRLLTVPQAASVVELDTFQTAVHWQTVSPGTLRDFSAACFYFARELQKKVAVPMGLVSAAWGGSRIEAWMSTAALRAEGRHDDGLDALALYARDPADGARRWGEIWQRWWQQRAGVAAVDKPWNPSQAPVGQWRKAPAALGAWEYWGEPALADYNGMVWYRTTVRLSAAQAAQQATLELGAIDETDMTWVNGRGVGSAYDPGSGRRYVLPPGLLRVGDNSVVVNVLDTYRDGGMNAPASAYRLSFGDGTSVLLQGWRYRAAPGDGAPPSAPWQTAGGLASLYNGMIAPIGPYGLRGVLWYQGESNTGESGSYQALLKTLSRDWRTRFGAALPFLVVQLAGYGMPPTHPRESGWAGLREAQRQFAYEDPHAALVVALDIGDRYDIHPPNKQELGRRLARAARALVYGQPLAASGPVPVSARREDDTVIVRFAEASEPLLAYGADTPVGFELCGAAPGSCRYATARIRGQEVVLHGPLEQPATRVRYGWADNPVVTLFDSSGLPAGPFEMEIP
ncbi:9-O-acetylesterase [Pseudoxanthomonas gei]|uniref:9-O-acetylesterase n=2 Tax=Pseudoxanthomonas gei TaxID=1383030 RepID=A0ABX0A9D2_9GAMM|nr:9-O-acetylesterase [Pseudoxanthomonas gei]